MIFITCMNIHYTKIPTGTFQAKGVSERTIGEYLNAFLWLLYSYCDISNHMARSLMFVAHWAVLSILQIQRVCILPRPRSNERLYLIIFIRGGLKQMQLLLLDYIFMYICGIYNHVQKHLLSRVFIFDWLDFDLTLTASLPCMKGYIESGFHRQEGIS